MPGSDVSDAARATPHPPQPVPASLPCTATERTRPELVPLPASITAEVDSRVPSTATVAITAVAPSLPTATATAPARYLHISTLLMSQAIEPKIRL